MAYPNPLGYNKFDALKNSNSGISHIISQFLLVVKNNSSDRSVNMKTQNSSDLCCFRPCLGA